MEWVQRVATLHHEEGGGSEDGELSTAWFPICASLGPVAGHIDTFDGEEIGKLIYGLVLKSDGHVLHTRSHPEGMPLSVGDLYSLDPHDWHWTTCPNADSELIFAATFLHHTDPRYGKPNKIAHDLRWEVLAQSIECARQVRRELEIDQAAMRGVGSSALDG